MSADELKRILDILDPDYEPGKITLISRYGANQVENCLPAHIKAVLESGHKPVFACDAMHGNTRTSTADATLKTRNFDDIMAEIIKSFEIHRSRGSRLSGIHLELSVESFNLS